MKILSFSPYQRGRSNEVLISLLAKYLRAEGLKVDALQCDGCFSVCERDAIQHWRSSFNKCFTCQSGQNKVADFQDTTKLRLGASLTPEEIFSTKQLVLECPSEYLTQLTWGSKVNLFDLCAGTFESRFGRRDLLVDNVEQVTFARQLVLSALRQYIAVNKQILAGKYQLSLVPDGSDILTCTFVCAARNAGASPVVFKFDRLDANVFVINPNSAEIKVCEGVPSSISELAKDVANWPEELHLMLRDILSFLGIDNEQLVLPLAR
jgi:hypothetical protein